MTDDLNQQEIVRDEKGRFPPGVSGNPAGRPKGSRHKLEEDFLAALARRFDKIGTAAVDNLDDKTLCEMIVKVLPKESKIEHSTNETWGDLVRRAADALGKPKP